MKKIFDIRHIVIAILVILAVVEFINPKGIMPHRVKIQTDSIPYAVHDTIPVDSLVEVEVEVPVEVEVEKPVPYAVHDTIPALVDTNFIVNQYLNATNVFTNTYKFDKKQGSITITDTISKNKIVGRKYTTKITPRVDTLRIPEPFKRKVFFGFEGGFGKNDVVSHIGTGIIVTTKNDKLFHIGVGVANRVLDGTNGGFTPYVGGGVYWKIKLKK
jgi:hypothetical protein